MSAAALILAAGQGTRMKSGLPKVAHHILGVPMIAHVIDAARSAGAARIVVVTGHGAEAVESALAGAGVEFALQAERLGTGHAVMCAESAFADADGSLLVLSGDAPLVTAETLSRLVAEREAAAAAMAVLTAVIPDPMLGRVVRDADGRVDRIVEAKDATPEEASITEVNTGTYCFDARVLFEHLHRLGNDNAQSEYYLTDMVALFRAERLPVVAVMADDPAEGMGINTRIQLAQATRALQRRINERHMLSGVTMTDPDLVWIGPHVTLGRDVVLEPMTFLFGATAIGDRCVTGPDTRNTDSTVGSDCIADSSVVEGSSLPERVTVGPRAYLRPGVRMEEGSKAGASVEIKTSTIGAAAKIPHLSYIGDAEIGAGANLGAGTITCNYDGVHKHRTIVGDGAFVGSDTMLVAPVEIGGGAVIGAGSTISHNVPPAALAIERSEQRVIEGWAARRREARRREAWQDDE
jgi:bifunctional UDP-N-acetylglucosamine pyrophosphorylase/glucosamine-1-phosphate N-acetyltransferase